MARQVTVGTTSIEIVANLPGQTFRQYPVLVQVVSGGPVYVTSEGAATAADFPVPTGGVFEFDRGLVLNGIVASGSADVRVWEES